MPAAKRIAAVARTCETSVIEHIVSLLPLVPSDMLPSAINFLEQYRSQHVSHAAVQPQLNLTMQEITLLWCFRQLPHDECRNSAIEAMQAYVEPRWEMENEQPFYQD